VLSDHADWPGLQQAIGESGASRVVVTHGYVPVMVRWLAEQGIEARAFDTEYGGDEGVVQDDAPPDDAPPGDGRPPR
jgi:putative mRNA 3-end processing factor